MRVTRLGRDFPLLQAGYGSTTQIPSGGDSGQVPTSNGSNGVYYGPNVATITANGSNSVLGPFVNLAAGSNTTLSVSSNTITVHSTGGGGGGASLTTQDEGVTLSTAVTTLDFVGAGVTATGAGATTTVTIPGGGGSTIVYPSLKSAVTDDFNSTLTGWTAVQTGGTFTITPCIAQTLDGSHLFMPFFANSGFIYTSTTNVDQEWIAGGLIAPTRGGDLFYGIAVLDTSNNGMGLIYHTSDNTCALITITAGVYDGVNAAVTSVLFGSFIGSPTKLWLRLTRVTNTWDAYVSLDGVNWNDGTTTINKTITAARCAIGVFTASTTLVGTLYADWVKKV